MKKILIIGLVILTILTSGCVRRDAPQEVEGLEVVSNMVILVQSDNNKNSPHIVYDIDTEIVYFMSKAYYGNYIITPYYDYTGEVMNKDQYLEKYGK